MIRGHAVKLIHDGSRLVIREYINGGRQGACLRVPLTACLSPGLTQELRDGVAVLRLRLLVRLGLEPLPLSCDFPPACQAELQRLVTDLGGTTQIQPVTTAGRRRRALPDLVRLPVRTVPDNADWISFQPLPACAEVLESTRDELG